MKKLLVVSTFVALACTSVFAADGATIYKKCIACHGAKAEKVYLNKIPALNTLEAATMVEDMKKYKAGERNEFKMGAIMKGQMATLSEDDMKAVAEYIQTLK
ncbi:c-type cytochrome [Campylobacter geochelonis]|uniref:Cytochrome c family protein n=1 Tax=Campylobacter geochelonis TaxID=1780362 RepID=A0A128EEZ4_9BACT|nr:c-type cytochrome [Campylobacter geochelonis]QKF71907.1 periplasmic monoheme cytochrome c553 [Campylobacter geochelonis]CZE47127.1 cytochrome c family protein [Campylobacter geochelonis]CZE47896.1 cytochrome c family protein [Campylobacter geochelonis]CZE51019.1 cytochrome c family protein [Campylobacter geochelonis]